MFRRQIIAPHYPSRSPEVNPSYRRSQQHSDTASRSNTPPPTEPAQPSNAEHSLPLRRQQSFSERIQSSIRRDREAEEDEPPSSVEHVEFAGPIRGRERAPSDSTLRHVGEDSEHNPNNNDALLEDYRAAVQRLAHQQDGRHSVGPTRVPSRRQHRSSSLQWHVDEPKHPPSAPSPTLTAQGFTTHNPPAMPMSTGIARQAPSPSAQSQASLSQQSQANGLTNGLIPNGLPPAGQQTDINYLWGLVQELSDVLAQNRAQTAGLVEQVRQFREREQAQRQQRSENGDSAEGSQLPTNGDADHTRDVSASEAAITIASLRSQLHQSHTQTQSLENELSRQCDLNDHYANAMHLVMDKIRVYAQSHSNAIIGIHSHYNKLLEDERDANLQLRIEHGEWQASLGRAADYARRALRARSEETESMDRKWREVRAENRVLRSLLGWEVPKESDDEEEEEKASEVCDRQGKRRSGLGRGLSSVGTGRTGGGGQNISMPSGGGSTG